jgi:hypothetical protein
MTIPQGQITSMHKINAHVFMFSAPVDKSAIEQ